MRNRLRSHTRELHRFGSASLRLRLRAEPQAFSAKARNDEARHAHLLAGQDRCNHSMRRAFLAQHADDGRERLKDALATRPWRRDKICGDFRQPLHSV